MEIWTDIKGYEGKYKISNLGKVKSLDRITIYFNKSKRNWEGRILKNVVKHKKDNSYLHVTLFDKGSRKIYLVHRLVAQAFIPNLNNLPQVNHKNGIKYDNKVENLEWITAKGNSNHAYRELGIKVPKKLSKKQVNEIKDRYFNKKETQTKLYKEYGLCETTIHKYLFDKHKTPF